MLLLQVCSIAIIAIIMIIIILLIVNIIPREFKKCYKNEEK